MFLHWVLGTRGFGRHCAARGSCPRAVGVVGCAPAVACAGHVEGEPLGAPHAAVGWGIPAPCRGEGGVGRTGADAHFWGRSSKGSKCSLTPGPTALRQREWGMWMDQLGPLPEVWGAVRLAHLKQYRLSSCHKRYRELTVCQSQGAGGASGMDPCQIRHSSFATSRCSRHCFGF